MRKAAHSFFGEDSTAENSDTKRHIGVFVVRQSSAGSVSWTDEASRSGFHNSPIETTNTTGELNSHESQHYLTVQHKYLYRMWHHACE